MEGIGMKRNLMKFWIRLTFVSLAVVSAAALTACASGPVSKYKSQALYGMIYDRDNKPVHNAAVYVNQKYMVSSDINGHFAIPQIRPKVQYLVTVKKPNYEEVEIEIAYTDPSYVLYVRMLSGDQFLSEAEQALKEKDWSKAENFLTKAEQVGADSTSVQYLRAVHFFYRERYKEALECLGSLTEIEKNAPYLYLFIADIYQYGLNDPDQARVYLRRFLEICHDVEVSNRLREIEGV
jgi:tetratricopeptide (TPR) repeat protein